MVTPNTSLNLYIVKNSHLETIVAHSYTSPVGELIIGSFGEKLCLCDWRYRKMRSTVDNRLRSFYHAEFAEGSSAIIERTISQLEEYFSGGRKGFELSLDFAGTDFQVQVWNALLKIPFGKTVSYFELAEKLENPGAIRAVASANGANAISIIVPCHRVIGAYGSLTGYAGGLPAKKKLLQLEKASVVGQTELF